MKKPLEENGIHRAKLWEIGFYALNNTSTNIYMRLTCRHPILLTTLLPSRPSAPDVLFIVSDWTHSAQVPFPSKETEPMSLHN